MQINSINTNLAAFSAQTNIRTAQSATTTSVARLSSGNQITQASDDVAGLSIGTSLATNVSTLRTALVNASQGISLLAVADSALNQITEILQRQKSIAVQAGSGTLGDTERAFLDAEFQALSLEIDRISSNTNFNGVNLIDGGLNAAANVASQTTAATAGTSSITFSSTISVGEIVVINGVTLQAGATASGTTFEVGATVQDTVSNLASRLNSLASNTTYMATLGEATYTANGSTLEIAARSGGQLSNNFNITDVSTTSTISAGNVDFTEGSATITVTQTSHGYAVGDVIEFSGGDQINGDVLYGRHTIATVTDANTYTVTLGDTVDGVLLGANPLTSDDVGAGGTPTITATIRNHGLQVGQRVSISGATLSNNITAAEYNQTFTVASVVDADTITYSFATAAASPAAGAGTGDTDVTGDPAAAAGGGSAANLYVDTNSAAITVKQVTATSNGQANISNDSTGASLNFFATGSAITSSTQVVSATTAASNAPFQIGDSITLTVDGVAKTLMTLTSGGGTGTSNLYTLQDVVDGINANKSTTGVGATMTFDGTNYNIRLNYAGSAGNVLLNAGANYNSGTSASGFALGGFEIGSNNQEVVTAGLTDNLSIYYTGFIDVLDPGANSINSGAIATTITAASPSATSAPFQIGENLTITRHNEEIILHTFQANDGVDDILASINAKVADTGVYAIATADANTGTAFNIRLLVNTADTSDAVTVSAGATLDTVGISTLSTNREGSLTTTGAALTKVTTASLQGGVEDGLSQGSVTATGTVGDNILATLSQERANVDLILTQNAAAGDTLTVGGVVFRYTANTTGAPNEILLSTKTDTDAAIRETLDNTINTITEYLSNGHALGTAAFELEQIDIRRDGNSLTFSGVGQSNVTTLTGGNAAIAQSITGSSVTNSGNLTNAPTTYGVDVTGVTNKDFTGSISGFTATYKDVADTVDISVTIGSETYTALNVDTTVASDTRIRLYADGTGGYFDIQLNGGAVTSFTDQAGADEVANRLNAAFSSLSFLQNRNVTSYSGTESISVSSTVIGSLLDTSVSAQIDGFDNLDLTDISVTAPSGSSTDASITLTINDVAYSTQTGLGNKLGANQTFTLVSANDPNQFVEFTTGDVAIELDSDAKAAAVEDALLTAFGVVDGSASLNFQVGTDTSDTLSISISDAGTEELYAGASLNVLTSEAAAIAVAALDVAIQNVTAVRAEVGATQSRFNFAAANIESSIQNQDAARGTLLDTDIANESTQYSIAQVKLQAGISVLAQANQQLQSLLKLIG